MLKKILIFSITFISLNLSSAQQEIYTTIDMNDCINIGFESKKKPKLIGRIINLTDEIIEISGIKIGIRCIKKAYIDARNIPSFLLPDCDSYKIDIAIRKTKDGINIEPFYIVLNDEELAEENSILQKIQANNQIAHLQHQEPQIHLIRAPAIQINQAPIPYQPINQVFENQEAPLQISRQQPREEDLNENQPLLNNKNNCCTIS